MDGIKKKKTCDHRDNIYKIVTNLDDAFNYFEKNSNEIINKFNDKFQKYLLDYISINQQLFDSLYNYIKKKMNDNNIQEFSLQYRDLVIEMKLKFSNYEKLKEKYNICETESYITNLETNLNLIINDFYSLYYLNNKTEYFQYPKEIIPKIKYIQNQIRKIKEPLKEKINNIYNNKIMQTYKINNKFINDVNKYNEKYILNTVNFTYIIDEYKEVKVNNINDIFNYIDIENIPNINGNNLLNINNYDKLIDKVLFKINEFINNFEKEINETFIINNNDSSINESLKNNNPQENISNYNFNIVKLKNSLYYSKNIIKNIFNLFDEFNFDDIINENLIINIDNIINEKGLFEIYDRANTKLRQINKETFEIVKPEYENFIKTFTSKYNYEDDIYPNIQIFTTILNLSDINFINYTNQFNEINLNEIEQLLDMVNQTLDNQINLNNNYSFPINITYLENSLINLNKSINCIINDNKEDINNMKKRGKIYNILRNIINKKIDEKIDYSKIEIDNYFKKYDIKYLNYSINIGDYVAKYIKKQYDNYSLRYINDYVEIFENINNYWKYLEEDIINIENNIYLKFNNLYNYYYLNYISKYKKEEDKNINKTLNDEMNCSYCENETDIIVTEEYQSNFENNSKNLNIIILNIKKLIEKFKKDENYLYIYLNKEINLDNYNFTLDDISSSFVAFDDYRAFINNKKKPEYKDLLKSSLIFYFNKSYNEYINNYISEYIISNIDILINEKLSLLIDLLKNKIVDDFHFYKLLLNETHLICDSIELNFMKLYSDLKLKINETINSHLDYYLLFNLEQLKNNTKKYFISKYLELYGLKDNKLVDIYQSKQFIYDIEKEISFNLTLDNIFENIFNVSIRDKINLILNNTIYSKLNNLFELIDFQNNEINNILRSIPKQKISKEVNKIIFIIDEYNKLVKNYKLKFLFSFSDNPFLMINEFSDKYLEPTLLTIKNEYNKIEKELMQEVIEKLNNINDFSSMIKENLDLDSKVLYINNFIEQIKSFIFDYYSYFINDIDQYYCKLAYFTIIDEQDYVNQPYNFSFCNINLNLSQNLRELNENDEINISKYFKKIPKLNISRFGNKERKLEIIEGEYNSKSPSLSKDDIIFFYLFFNETLNGLIDGILSTEFEILKTAANSSINELLNKYLPNLKTTVDITEKKFASILTEENMIILYQHLYKSYYEIENITQNYTSSIFETMEPLYNSLNNTRQFLDLMNHFAFNFMMETENKCNEQLHSKLDKSFSSNNEMRMTKKAIQNINNKIEKGLEGVYNETLDNYNKIKENYEKPMIKLNNVIYLLDFESEEFLKIIQKDILKNKNISLVSSIAKYELQKLKNSKPKELSISGNIPSIFIDFDDITFAYFMPIIIKPVFQMIDITYTLNIGINYLYEEDDEETPKDMTIFQKFIINMIAKANTNTYIPISDGTSISFGLQGTLSNYQSETTIEINCLVNTYSILLNATNSYNFHYFLKLEIKIRDFTGYFYLLSEKKSKNKETQQFYKEYSFRDQLLDTSILKKISLFSSYDIDLQSLSGKY